MQNEECMVQETVRGGRMQHAGCGMQEVWSAGCRVRGSECGVQSAGCRTQGVECGVRFHMYRK